MTIMGDFDKWFAKLLYLFLYGNKQQQQDISVL